MNARGHGDAPGVIAPPPLIYGASLVLGFALEQVWPTHILPAALRYGLGVPAVGGSFLLAVWAVMQFHRAGTHIDVRKPATALATSGPYRFSRNPIYLALTALYLGIGLTAGSLWAAVFVVPALVIMHFGVIRREERYLERRFGADYLRYTRAVRRWV